MINDAFGMDVAAAAATLKHAAHSADAAGSAKALKHRAAAATNASAGLEVHRMAT
ncbi:hypothetical protein HMPREF0591_4138 [Mycobacterium parascrofulaceum ATCC BAA-614]|uniref:Uncharacterized protein n=1 Tax=Mycobacterium parascrofulaceum ATCC BAA-614 TaxID=525368 RepID=D5PD94_9MYCO|nr:hypothetical protein [Mycobacterium parascrofulaceum]EFG75953.1 hypothetical protein HMPREF0591_4138 [Mycobacterium parascrofulaceum ATCC BAA-614]